MFWRWLVHSFALIKIESVFCFYLDLAGCNFIVTCFNNIRFQGADGILVPGGFGDRGVQGKILATKYARENNIPFLGICLGMQIAVIEFARSVLGLCDANSTEFDPETLNPCVIFMPEVLNTRLVFSGWTSLSTSIIWTVEHTFYSTW